MTHVIQAARLEYRAQSLVQFSWVQALAINYLTLLAGADAEALITSDDLPVKEDPADSRI